eukprot:6177148-Pleurochrysis_carterae.AAC.2
MLSPSAPGLNPANVSRVTLEARTSLASVSPSDADPTNRNPRNTTHSSEPPSPFGWMGSYPSCQVCFSRMHLRPEEAPEYAY